MSKYFSRILAAKVKMGVDNVGAVEKGWRN